MEGESLQSHVSFATAATPTQPTINRQLRCTLVRGAGAGLYTLVTTEPNALRDCDIAASLGAGAAGLSVNIVRVDDFTWTVRIYHVTGGTFALDDTAGNQVRVTLKRVDAA
jgi:hypothetical protein